MLLGVISLTLAGCHTQKKAAAPEPQGQEQTVGEEEMPIPEAPRPAIVVKYGVPPQML